MAGSERGLRGLGPAGSDSGAGCPWHGAGLRRSSSRWSGVRCTERPGRVTARGLGLPPAPPAPPEPPAPRAEAEDEERVPLAEISLMNKLIHTSLVESQEHVEILQRDPSSPLFSIKTFEELPLKKELLQGVYMMGFNRPSKIQEQALPLMLAYPPQNLIAQSQSGTGKTAAFVLAMLSRASANEKYPQCLCLAPTYELALQIGQVVRTIGKFCTDIKVNYAVRGNRVLKGTVLEEQIIIGTPGTTLDWCFKQRILDLTKISLFVLDEADIMIDTQGLSCQSIRIHRALPESCQVLLFSATYKEPVRAFAERIIPDPIVIKLREEELTLSNIRQYFMVCESSDEQYRALCNLYGSFTIGQVMIFCQVRPLPGRALHGPSPVGNSRNGSFYSVGTVGFSQDPQNKGADPRGVLKTAMSSLTRSRALWRGICWLSLSPRVQTRRLADWLSGKMSWDGHQVAILTAELTVVQRASVIQRFREGKEKVLIATNVCARGIDVQQVTTVVNFGLPMDQDGEPDFETYLHRIGRAGRFGHRGIAFSVVQRGAVGLVHKIEQYFRKFPKKQPWRLCATCKGR
ncbi:ATP-dependent RNA helicase DDX25 isoform X2 [Prinia subflava]|uniref:ATP-dependent RNA helicase DDX25 isoform X2 n=1 Tax=Prinia subflava TaxID=208062 RepID=UPI002FE188B8